MNKCKVCKNNYKFPHDCEPACNCMCENYNCFEPITNADYIRSMSNEELAEFICDIYNDGVDNGEYSMLDFDVKHIDMDSLLSWLKDEYSEEAT